MAYRVLPFILIFVFFACGGRKPAEPVKGATELQLESKVQRAEKAAVQAQESARLCQTESEKLRQELEALRGMLSISEGIEKSCSNLAGAAERKIRAREAALKKMEEELKAAAALPQPTKPAGVPEYSSSDAPVQPQSLPAPH